MTPVCVTSATTEDQLKVELLICVSKKGRSSRKTWALIPSLMGKARRQSRLKSLLPHPIGEKASIADPSSFKSMDSVMEEFCLRLHRELCSILGLEPARKKYTWTATFIFRVSDVKGRELYSCPILNWVENDFSKYCQGIGKIVQSKNDAQIFIRALPSDEKG